MYLFNCCILLYPAQFAFLDNIYWTGNGPFSIEGQSKAVWTSGITWLWFEAEAIPAVHCEQAGDVDKKLHLQHQSQPVLFPIRLDICRRTGVHLTDSHGSLQWAWGWCLLMTVMVDVLSGTTPLAVTNDAMLCCFMLCCMTCFFTKLLLWGHSHINKCYCDVILMTVSLMLLLCCGHIRHAICGHDVTVHWTGKSSISCHVNIFVLLLFITTSCFAVWLEWSVAVHYHSQHWQW